MGRASNRPKLIVDLARLQDVTNGDNGDGRKADKCKAEKQRAAKRRRELEEEEEVRGLHCLVHALHSGSHSTP